MTMNEFHIGDFNEIAQDLPAVDLILTDPPYKRKENSLECFQMLARWAPELLKDGGSLITIVPHYLLEQVMLTMHEALKFRWIYNMDQEAGSHPRMAMGIEVCWKPILHYVQRAFPPGRGFMRDKIIMPSPSKRHEYEQPEEWAEYFISKLTNTGDLVLDPFVGTGTVPAVANRLGRKYIGVDIDPDMIMASIKRVDHGTSQ